MGNNTSYDIVVFDMDNKYGGMSMIDFEEELKKFQPSLEVEEAEEAIYNRDLTDMASILLELMREKNS